MKIIETLDRLDELEKKAAKTPWNTNIVDGELWGIRNEDRYAKDIVTCDAGYYGPGIPTGTFIVELRNAWPSISKEVRKYREALESVILSDKTPVYEYGEKNRQGVKPGIGQRWLNPKEIAREALEEK